MGKFGHPVENDVDNGARNILLAPAAHEKKVRILLIKNRIFPLIDPVGVGHNGTQPRLPVDLRQSDHLYTAAGNNIFQHVSWAHRWELIHIADQNKARPWHDRL